MTKEHEKERALVAALIPHLEWRHHGIGCLQAYVREDAEPEVRVHIWHPALVRPGIRESGDIHDHRFDLESTVLVGHLVEETYFEEERFDREHCPEDMVLCDIWDVQNARAAGAAAGFDGTCVRARESVRMYLRGLNHWRADQFSHYKLPRGVFHKTVADELTITICTLREKRGQARILTPAGVPPVHAFSAIVGENAEVYHEMVLDEALLALEKAS